MKTKLCVDCRRYISIDNFDQASQSFPTRDGLQFCCREHRKGKPRLVRMENGKVEIDREAR